MRRLVNLCLIVIPLLLLEGLARLLLLVLPPPPASMRWGNRHHPEMAPLVLRDDVPLADTVRQNLEENPFLIPDERLLFRVRPNPGGGPVLQCEGINADGFRTRHAPSGKDRPSRRLLILGDSCMFGWGIPDFASTIPGRIEASLDPGGNSWGVYSLAQPGYSTYQGMLLFDAWRDRVGPDVVVVSFGWNDVWPTPRFTDRETIAIARWTNSSPARIARTTGLYALLEAIARTWARPADRATLLPRVPLGEVFDLLDRLLGESARLGARVVIVLPPHPCRDDLAAHYGNLDRYNRAIAMRYRDTALFPDLEALRCGSPGAETYFLDDGIHLNRRGSAVMADAIVTVLQK